MPGCVFHAMGSEFDVEGFLKQSPWREFAFVLHRGEPTGLRPDQDETNSGLSIRISDSDEDNLERQIHDAMDFLEKEGAEIRRLAAFPGVESLEFRIGLFWYWGTLCQFHTLCPEFLRTAGNFGVAVTLCMYGASGDEEQASADAKPAPVPNRRPPGQARTRLRRRG